MNMNPRITASHIKVLAAFFDSGGLNACTPFEVVSIPVIAVQPEAKARRTNMMLIMPREPVAAVVDCFETASGKFPETKWNAP